MEKWLHPHYSLTLFSFLDLGLSECQDHSPPHRADIAVSYRWGIVSLPLPYVIKLKICSFFLFFLVSRSLELQKFLLSLYSSHHLFGIMQDLLRVFMASTFECKSILEQDMSKRKQSE